MTPSVDQQIANQALMLAMEWGENFRKPIQDRLAKLYSTLQPTELDHYNALAQEAMRAGHAMVYEQVEKLGQSSTHLPAICKRLFLARYPWASDESAGRVYSQGMYYAWHDGVGA